MSDDDLDEIAYANKLIEARRLISELTTSVLKKNPRAKRESEEAYEARIKKLIVEEMRASPELSEAAMRLTAHDLLNKRQPPH
jgi:hypothetical protein